jgi:hypothetical protein
VAAKPPENNKPLFVGCLKRAVSYFPLNHPQTSRHCGMTASRLRCRRACDLMALPLLFLPAKRKHSSFAYDALGAPISPKPQSKFLRGATLKKVLAFAFQDLKRVSLVGKRQVLCYGST